jgi:NAD(P)-dependent dehydrogenase (short-subunit alcohol dehydrogenase family)
VGEKVSRNTVVTGGSSGIGAAVVETLITKGHTVTVFDLNPHPDTSIPTEIVDVTDEDSVAQAFQRTITRTPVVTGLVASHGSRGSYQPALTMPVKDIQSQFAIHTVGSFLVAREFARQLNQTPGSVVFLSSTTAYGGWANQVDYGLAKAALTQLTKNLAIEWASLGIRVNAVAPGHTMTPMVQDLVTKGYDLTETKKRMPMGRLADPAEIAATIAHLLDDATFVTGQCVAVDGGWTALGK